MTAFLIALFGAYALLVTWQMRRAIATREPGARQREAVRLLLLVSVGAPLAAILILVA